MKKILLGTTAVVALGTLSTEAFAADKIKLELGGFMRQYVGFSNSDEVAVTAGNEAARDTGIGQYSNTEVYFSGSTTLDNGLTVKSVIQLEADDGATTAIDETYLTISSDNMGALTLGSRPHAAASLDVRAPNAGNMSWEDLDDWAGSATTGTGDVGAFTWSANDVDGNMTDDTIKVVYISPNFNGVTVGASWAADDNLGDNDAELVTNANTDAYSFAIAYGGDFDGVSVDASLLHARVAETHDQSALGLSVGVAGFTIGGAYYDFDGVATSGATNTNSRDGKAWELGVAYATGPYSVSAAYMNSEAAGTTAIAGDDEDTAWELAATYDMGAGVALTATYFDIQSDGEGTAQAAVDANGLIAGIEVGF